MPLLCYNIIFTRSRVTFGMADSVLNRLLYLKVARDRKGRAPNKPLLV